MMFLLENWKSAFTAIFSSIITAIFAYGVHTTIIAYNEASHKKAIKNTIIEMQQACMESKQKTEEIANEYKNKLIDRDNRINSLYKQDSIMSATGDAPRVNGATTSRFSGKAPSGIEYEAYDYTIKLGLFQENWKEALKKCQK